MSHTIKMVTAKIGLQRAWIEEYFSGFFFDVHSSSRGDSESFLAIICD